MKKYTTIIFCLILAAKVSAGGGGGVGNIVFDPSNFSQNSSNTAKTILQLAEDLKQTQNDLQQIQQLYHLMEVADINVLPLNKLYNSQVQTLENQLNNAGAISYDAQTINANFQTVYPEWSDENGLGAVEYNKRITTWQGATRNAVKKSFEAQGIESVIKEGRVSLQDLLTQNSNVQGELQALQVLTQVSGLVADQLLTLNQMTAQQFRAQSHQYMSDLERRREAEEWAKRVRCGALDNC